MRSGGADAAVAVTGDTGPRATTGEVSVASQTAIPSLLQRSGLYEPLSDGIAPMTIAVIQGALVMSRAQASLTPLDTLVSQLE